MKLREELITFRNIAKLTEILIHYYHGSRASRIKSDNYQKRMKMK